MKYVFLNRDGSVKISDVYNINIGQRYIVPEMKSLPSLCDGYIEPAKIEERVYNCRRLNFSVDVFIEQDAVYTEEAYLQVLLNTINLGNVVKTK